MLTQRQIEVLNLVKDGMPAKGIALKLGISYNTVRRHLAEIYRRLEVNNASQAVYVATEYGLLKPQPGVFSFE